MKVAVLINSEEQQYEGLRSSLGMLLYSTNVEMYPDWDSKILPPRPKMQR